METAAATAVKEEDTAMDGDGQAAAAAAAAAAAEQAKKEKKKEKKEKKKAAATAAAAAAAAAGAAAAAELTPEDGPARIAAVAAAEAAAAGANVAAAAAAAIGADVVVKKEKKDKSKKEEKKEKKKKDKEKEKEKEMKEEVAEGAQKRPRSQSAGGARKRQSKWDPDTTVAEDPAGEPSVPAATDSSAVMTAPSPTAMQVESSATAGAGEEASAAKDLEPEAAEAAQKTQTYEVESEFVPKFTEEELKVRTIELDNVPQNVTSKELAEFFSGAVLTVTANNVQLAGSRKRSPVFSCTIPEQQGTTAELKFRTPEGASVGMKLNGIDFKGNKLITKRPEGFPMPDDGLDPSVTLSLQDMSIDCLVGAVMAPVVEEDTGPKPQLCLHNLPDVLTEENMEDLLSQFGPVRVCKLPRDPETGKLKGTCLFDYEDPADADVAIPALNGFVCGQNVIVAKRLNLPAPPKRKAIVEMENSMTQKIVASPAIAQQVKAGLEAGHKPSTVVQILNAVHVEDTLGDEDYEDIMAEVRTEAGKHGAVASILIPKPSKDGSYVDGVGKIFVQFKDLTAARKFQLENNGRKFDNRVMCAAFYPVDKFGEGKLQLF